ncbi:MAG: hypothetical protein KGI60_04585 [Patescibacteria group bacterium]|nr:hypothetical protein [Patescibacteria group bacterium]
MIKEGILIFIAVLCAAAVAYLDFKELREGNFDGYRNRNWLLAPGTFAVLSLHEFFETWHLSDTFFVFLAVIYFGVFLSLPKVLKMYFAPPPDR